MPNGKFDYECLRCGHKWVKSPYHDTIEADPKQCPDCHSPYWNKARKRG